MKTPYLDKEIELLEGFKDNKEASFYQLRKLAEYLEIKQLLIHSVVKSFYCYDETVQIAEETGDKIIRCDKQCEKCKQ